MQSYQKQKKYETCEKISRFIGGSIGFFTALTNLALLYKGSVKAVSEFSSSPILQNSLSTVISLIVAQVLVRASMDAASNIGSRIVHFVTWQETTSLRKVLAPKTAMAVEILGTILAAFSYGPSVPLSKEYFGDNWFGKFIAIASSIHLIFLILHSLEDLTDDAIAYYFKKHGTEIDKDLLFLFSRFEQLEKIYDESSLIELMKYIKQLPETIKEELTDIIPDLESKIETHIPSHNSSRDDMTASLLHPGLQV